MKNDLRFLDVSGVGNSGKSAVVDLLREIDGFYVPHFQFEFDLLRVPGGLLDLRRAVTEDWSPVRSHAAIDRFRRKMRTMGLDPRPWDLRGLLASSGQRYAGHFGSAYFDAFNQLLEDLIVASYRSEWPYEDLEFNGFKRTAFRVARRLGMRDRVLHNVLLVDGSRFDVQAAKALRALYQPRIAEADHTVILNNGIEPFNPAPGLDMLGPSARQIVVLRDPRDIFVSGQNHAKGALTKLQAPDNDGLNKGFLATDDVTLFCRRMALHLTNLPNDDDPRILKVWFEDLVTKPDETNHRIARFLGFDQTAHTRKNKFLKPNISARMVGIAHEMTDQTPIKHIATELASYLYPGFNSAT